MELLTAMECFSNSYYERTLIRLSFILITAFNLMNVCSVTYIFKIYSFYINLIFQVAVLEATINEKKRQVEKLVADMKEANLQSLAMSPPEELKMILEGWF